MMQFQSKSKYGERLRFRLALPCLLSCGLLSAGPLWAQPDIQAGAFGAGTKFDMAGNNCDLSPCDESEDELFTEDEVPSALQELVEAVPAGESHSSADGGAGAEGAGDNSREPVGEPVNQSTSRLVPFETKPRREVELRNMMAAFGVGATPTQDAVLDHIADGVRSRTLLRRKTTALLDALKRADGSDAQVRALLEDYRNAVEIDKERRRRAEDSLNERIGFKDNARLEAVLVLLGAIGDSPIIVPFGPRPFPARKSLGVNANRRPNDRIADNANAGNATLEQPVFEDEAFNEPDRPAPDQRKPSRQPERATSEGKGREGVLLGTVMARRRDRIDVKADDGVIHRFEPRWNIDATPEGFKGGAKRAAQVWTQLATGDRVRLKWVWLERKFVVAIERIDVDR